MAELIVAIDLGGTQVRAALCDYDGHILARAAQPTLASQGPEAVFSRIAATARGVAGDWSRVRAIGLGSPGAIDPWKGLIRFAYNLPGVLEFPMKERLEKEFGVPASIGNDANLAALGEQRYGAGRGVSHMIYMTISTGVGGGIIVDGKLFRGWRGFAGEIGHQTLEASGPRCNCGNVGCLEVLAAGPAIARNAREVLAAGRESKMLALANGDPSQVTGVIVTRAARDGDLLARQVLDRAGFYIGLGIVNLLHDFDTELFVLGGSVAEHAWEFIYPSVVSVLDQHAIPSIRRGVRVVRAQLGGDVGLLGAAALVISGYTLASER